MNIQIFGTKKCNDTKKAERFFKERGIKYQFIDMKEKGMSKGEFTSVAQAERRPGEHGQLGGERSGYAGSHPVHCGGGQAGKGAGKSIGDPHTDCQKRETVYHRLSAGGMEGLELRKREGMGQ